MKRLQLVTLALALTTLGTLLVSEQGATAAGFQVAGVQLKAYTKAGGLKALGAPVDNATCDLPAGGCMQHFAKGTIYSLGKRYGSSKATGLAGELIATERSQVGYVESYGGRGDRHKTWLNTWMKSRREWCSFLQSWAAWASGNSTAIPKKNSFAGFVKTATARLEVSRTPKVGALAMYAFEEPGEPSHVGLVTQVKGSRIRTIEGNTTGSGKLPAGKRGIVEVWRPRSSVVYYLIPD